MTAWPRLIRIETQLQTTQTDTTKRLAPDGAGGVEWAAAGAGSNCDHEHTFDRFVALGGSPETFTLTTEPMGAVMVHRGSPSPLSLIDPSDVTVVVSDVSLATTVDDIVVIFYATACTPCTPSVGDSGALVFPGDDASGDYNGNYISPAFSALTGDTITVDATDIPAGFRVDIYSVTLADALLAATSPPGWGPGIWTFAVTADETDWRVVVFDPDTGLYDGGLTGSGTYEVTTPC